LPQSFSDRRPTYPIDLAQVSFDEPLAGLELTCDDRIANLRDDLLPEWAGDCLYLG
jgi:hypothetical protein